MRREYLYDRKDVAGSAGSTWLVGRERPAHAALDKDVSADVVVVGGGLSGVLAALNIAEKGAEVVLVEGRRLCSDVSGHTTAKATAQHGLMTESVPQDDRVAWVRANAAAVDMLENAAAAAGGEAGFVRAPSYLYVTTADGVDGLRRELDLYRQAGLDGELLEDGLAAGMTAALRLDRQALINPVGLVDALIAQKPENLSVYEESMLRSVSDRHGHCAARCDRGTITADKLVAATHVPCFDTILYSTRLFQYRTYALEVEVREAPHGMWYTEEQPHLAWRPVSSAEPSRLIVSGIEHKAGHGDDERDRYRELVAACEARFPGMRVVRHWSTQDAETADGLPLIGRMVSRERCFMASGYAGWGMTSAAVAADLLGDLIAGSTHALEDVLTPGRLALEGLTTLAEENTNFIARAFAGETVPKGIADDVASGEGTTMRIGDDHVAVERREDGTVHVMDAHCTHMRCSVGYNEAEGTWDCPCHGSRFLGDGSWLHGPAKRDLDPVDTPD